jgi:glycosyltransferase involved in cell wall biosynthesis
MRVCLICVEFFIAKSGGFGRATRTIGRELVKRGVEVYAVVPQQGDQKPIEFHDGITVLSFQKYQPWKALELFRRADADVYHSCEPSMSTALARWSMRDRKHMITFRDPRDIRDWKKEFDRPARSKLQVVSNYLYESNFLVSGAVRRADRVYSLAKYLIPKIRRLYRLKSDPIFLPTPVDVPASVEKADRPTVGYLARWDRVKRPEIFLQLVAKFPEVQFVMGGSALDTSWDDELRQRYSGLPNLEIFGRIDQFREPERHSAFLGRCWVMVNASTKEALPNAFLEAAAHRCAILAGLDPEGFSSEFGYFVRPRDPAQDLPDPEDFAQGLRFLLEDDRWRERGQRGYQHVRHTFATERSIGLHIEAYRQLIEGRRPGAAVATG